MKLSRTYLRSYIKAASCPHCGEKPKRPFNKLRYVYCSARTATSQNGKMKMMRQKWAVGSNRNKQNYNAGIAATLSHPSKKKMVKSGGDENDCDKGCDSINNKSRGVNKDKRWMLQRTDQLLK